MYIYIYMLYIYITVGSNGPFERSNGPFEPNGWLERTVCGIPMGAHIASAVVALVLGKMELEWYDSIDMQTQNNFTYNHIPPHELVAIMRYVDDVLAFSNVLCGDCVF